jgi:hypothetical protein
MIRDDWIQTYSGRAVAPAALTPDDVCVADIAHALSMQCRFTGHCKSFYSVAEHSLEVSHLLARNGEEKHSFWGLMHDASEAYLVDVAAPMKHTPDFDAFRQVERRIMDVICRKFGMRKGEPARVKWADKAMLATEAAQLMAPLHPEWKNLVPPLDNHTIIAFAPAEAESAFLREFHRMTDGRWAGKETE